MELEFPIHHVVVIGFHHKKGCQIEFAFPPFEGDIDKTAWKHLPTLGIPDGAHNYAADTVYFHLPSLKRPGETVFGVACYQQIDAEKVKNKGEEVTRSSVQKSVAVLSKYPLYGHIQVKMSLITAAYFREGDFAQISILEEAYHNLNACLSPELLRTPEAFVGLSPRELIFTFKHDVLLLFKLLLLEKRILFRGASVGPLCSSLLTLVSLLPLSLEYGLGQSAVVPSTSKSSSATLDASKVSPQDQETEKMDAEKPVEDINLNVNPAMAIQGSVSSRHGQGQGADVTDECLKSSPSKLSLTGSEYSEKAVSDDIPDFLTAVSLTAADAGLPLQLFTNGYLCHPYLSLHYMDLLSDPNVRGFLAGATNILFKQKRDLVDVVVEMSEGGSVEFSDPAIKKLLTLTTEDLRFGECLVTNVFKEMGNSTEPGDCWMDGVGWEGGDEWVRAQFKYYLMSLMRTSLLENGARLRDSFGANYLCAWQSTENWRAWSAYVNSEERDTPGIYLLSPGHPCSGQMSMADMKLRLAHSMQKTEGGRKLNKAVASTGKAVGGALSSAKGALSSWWSSVTTAPPTGVEFGSEDAEAEEEVEPPKKNDNAPRSSTVWFTKEQDDL